MLIGKTPAWLAWLEWAGWDGISGLIAVIALLIAAVAFIDALGDRHAHLGHNWSVTRTNKANKELTIRFRALGPATMYEVGLDHNDTLVPFEDLEIEAVLDARDAPLTSTFHILQNPQHEPPQIQVTWATVRYGTPRTHHLEVTGLLRGQPLQIRYARERWFSKKLRWKQVKPRTEKGD